MTQVTRYIYTSRRHMAGETTPFSVAATESVPVPAGVDIPEDASAGPPSIELVDFFWQTRADDFQNLAAPGVTLYGNLDGRMQAYASERPGAPEYPPDPEYPPEPEVPGEEASDGEWDAYYEAMDAYYALVTTINDQYHRDQALWRLTWLDGAFLAGASVARCDADGAVTGRMVAQSVGGNQRPSVAAMDAEGVYLENAKTMRDAVLVAAGKDPGADFASNDHQVMAVTIAAARDLSFWGKKQGAYEVIQ